MSVIQVTCELRPLDLVHLSGRGVCSDLGAVQMWDGETGAPLRTWAGNSEVSGAAVAAIVYSKDGKLVVTTSHDGSARIWDAATGQLLHKLTGHDGPLTSAGFSPDGKWIVSASEDQTTRIWDVSTGKEICTLIAFADGTWAVIDPTGRYDGSNGGDVAGLHRVLGGKAVAASEFRAQRYTPGLLAKVLGIGK